MAVPAGVFVTHAGTGLDAGGRVVTAGGRVLSVTALGPDPLSARDTAYVAADAIDFDGRQLRRDIAEKVVARMTSLEPSRGAARRFEELPVDAPLVGIVMAAKSDLPTMEKAEKELTERGIRSEVRVMSAHHDPDVVADYARNAGMRGLRVIIAGASLGAALPGVVAAHTELPVIGVPLTSSGSVGGGLDALLAITQMPPGVPVATRRRRRRQKRGGAGRAHPRDLTEPSFRGRARRRPWPPAPGLPSGPRPACEAPGSPTARIRAASSPALRAPSIATVATGTPLGICTIESRLSSPSSLLSDTGTPITGRRGDRGQHSGKVGSAARPRDDHCETAGRRLLAVGDHLDRRAMRRDHARLGRDPELGEYLAGLTHDWQVAVRAHHHADDRLTHGARAYQRPRGPGPGPPRPFLHRR